MIFLKCIKAANKEEEKEGMFLGIDLRYERSKKEPFAPSRILIGIISFFKENQGNFLHSLNVLSFLPHPFYQTS